jgi:hypothetical protein
LQLEIPARREVLKDLLHDAAVVVEAGDDGAGVDVVEWLAEGPLFFCVVDLELAVCWDAVLI